MPNRQGDARQPRFEVRLSDEHDWDSHDYRELDRWGDLHHPYRFNRDWHRDDYGHIRLI